MMARPVQGPGRPVVRRGLGLVLALAAVFVAVYAVVVMLYARGGAMPERTETAIADGGVQFVLTPKDVDPTADRMTAELSFAPGSRLATPDGLSATSDVEVLVTSTHNRQLLQYTADQPSAPLAVELKTTGVVEQWPFDVHTISTIVLAYEGPSIATLTGDSDEGAGGGGASGAAVASGAAEPMPRPTETRLGDHHIPGWVISMQPDPREFVVDTADGEQAVQGYVITARRATATVAFGVVVLALLVAMPVLALTVAVLTLRGKRRVEPAFFGWIAGMLFATPTLRGFLPGSPPIGSWVDYLIVLWVIAGLILALVINVVAWYRAQSPLRATP